MEDPKNKIQDQSSNEPVKDALGDDLKMTKSNPSGNVPPTNNNNNTQNQGQPTNVPPQGQVLDESSQSQKQEQVQEEEEKEEENEDDFEPLPHEKEERANFSRPPGKRSAPKPKTG